MSRSKISVSNFWCVQTVFYGIPLPGELQDAARKTGCVVSTKKKIAIFIHGCYWHGHDCGSHYAHASQSNKAYWGSKIERTKQRDQEHIQALETDGWKVIVLWECEIRKDLDGALGALIAEL